MKDKLDMHGHPSTVAGGPRRYLHTAYADSRPTGGRGTKNVINNNTSIDDISTSKQDDEKG